MSNLKQKRSEQEMEALIQRQFRGMPHRHAPSTLAPKVMAALQARQAATWWHKPIGYWSMPARILILTAMILSAAAVTLTTSWLMTKGVPWFEAGWNYVTGIWDGLQTLANAGSMVLRGGLQPWIRAVLGISFLMYLLCLGAGTAFVRVALKKDVKNLCVCSK